MKLEFVVPGPPVPKERARVTIVQAPNGKRKGRGFTPERTAHYEAHVKLHALAARCKLTRWPWQDKTARFGIKVEVFRSVERGDLDNFVKSIKDGCNGVVWPDDRQVTCIDALVEQCEKGRERVNVEVWQRGT